MNTASLLKECEVRNITLRVVDDQLHYRAPKGALNDKLKKQLKDYKPELIKILSPELPPDYYDRHIERVVGELNYRAVRWTDIPEITRKRASKLELELTKTANQGNREAFLRALGEWRACFH